MLALLGKGSPEAHAARMRYETRDHYAVISWLLVLTDKQLNSKFLKCE